MKHVPQNSKVSDLGEMPGKYKYTYNVVETNMQKGLYFIVISQPKITISAIVVVCKKRHGTGTKLGGKEMSEG